MTYSNFRKIQTYILILIIFFIFNQNFHLIFKTRNITEVDQKNQVNLFFCKEISKNETKTKTVTNLELFKPSEGVNCIKNQQYIKDKQNKSFSKICGWIDNGIFYQKSLLNSIIYLFKTVSVSVKYRYISSQEFLVAWRKFYLKKLEELIGSRGRPLAEGLLFGDVSGIDQDTYHSFKVIGILHILSASSANFSIFLHFCLFFIKPFLKYLTRKWSFWLYFFIIFLYFSLVGPVASTTRAFLTLNLTFFAIFVLQRTNLAIFNLYLSGLFMLIINPFYLKSLSFQFSFLASFGILFLYNLLEKEPFINKNYLIRSILFTFSAQFFLFPILIFNFAELNYLAILANFLVLPLVELLTILFLVSFINLFITSFISTPSFSYVLSFLISKILDILFLLINLLEKITWKKIDFTGNKELYTMIFVIINLLSILLVFYLKNQKYSKNKYRVFK